MTTLRVQVDEEKNLALLQKTLTELGFKFSMESFGDEAPLVHALPGMKAGLKDVEEGRVYGHEQAMSRIKNKISQLGLNNAGH